MYEEFGCHALARGKSAHLREVRLAGVGMPNVKHAHARRWTDLAEQPLWRRARACHPVQQE